MEKVILIQTWKMAYHHIVHTQLSADDIPLFHSKFALKIASLKLYDTLQFWNLRASCLYFPSFSIELSLSPASIVAVELVSNQSMYRNYIICSAPKNTCFIHNFIGNIEQINQKQNPLLNELYQGTAKCEGIGNNMRRCDNMEI